jgi:hypothetical protein
VLTRKSGRGEPRIARPYPEATAQCGQNSPAAVFVIWVTPLPSGFMVNRSQNLVDGQCVKMIFVPPGDQLGLKLAPFPGALKVSWVNPLPSELMVAMFAVPCPFTCGNISNTIFFPSGDQFGICASSWVSPRSVDTSP